MIKIDVKEIYGEIAKLDRLPEYESAVINMAGSSQDVTLTGAVPVWLYLRLAHALHGTVRSLHYDSPVTGTVQIFDHDPLVGTAEVDE